MIGGFELVLESLDEYLPHVQVSYWPPLIQNFLELILKYKRYRNMHDLLRKLDWYPDLFIDDRLGWPSEDMKESLQSFRKKVLALLDCCQESTPNWISEDRISALPITDLLMGVCFDARPWTSIGLYNIQPFLLLHSKLE